MAIIHSATVEMADSGSRDCSVDASGWAAEGARSCAIKRRARSSLREMVVVFSAESGFLLMEDSQVSEPM